MAPRHGFATHSQPTSASDPSLVTPLCPPKNHSQPLLFFFSIGLLCPAHQTCSCLSSSLPSIISSSSPSTLACPPHRTAYPRTAPPHTAHKSVRPDVDGQSPFQACQTGVLHRNSAGSVRLYVWGGAWPAPAHGQRLAQKHGQERHLRKYMLHVLLKVAAAATQQAGALFFDLCCHIFRSLLAGPCSFLLCENKIHNHQQRGN